MTQMLTFSGRHCKAATINMHDPWIKVKIIAMNGKEDVLSRETETIKRKQIESYRIKKKSISEFLKTHWMGYTAEWKWKKINK